MTEKQPPSYPLRMPQELREQLTAVAKANNRSMNAEIVARLQESLTLKLDGTWVLDGSKKLEPAPSPYQSDDWAEKVAEKLVAKLGMAIPLEALKAIEAIPPDYANPRFKKPKSEKSG